MNLCAQPNVQATVVDLFLIIMSWTETIFKNYFIELFTKIIDDLWGSLSSCVKDYDRPHFDVGKVDDDQQELVF